ncbi:CDC7 protein kinase [Capronia epimyces CBS 606.96]|uniref:non-specific serine/threonine protein kinase n=1 Tax=Capronia epimyces CBS 606.96 TaxID=1182542 RepID=W9YBB5_9EURO|nr:CDC7 protein kinase [Capronia epimyces CBS 606.96]EXJ89808.1 CDC7 protein kinase [Capronia epimyces CBS 606.96]
MKLAKRAKCLLKGIGSKQSEKTTTETSQTTHARRHALLSRPAPDKLPREAAAAAAAAAARRAAEALRAVTGKSAAILGKRPRHDMGHPAIAIHEDEDVSLRETRRLDKPTTATTTKDMAQTQSEDGDSIDGSCYSEESEASDDDIDESVVEDMRKLEEDFKGISQRYRLINRIGEGTFSTVYKAEQLPQPNEINGHDENDEPADESNPDMPPSKRRKTNAGAGRSTKSRRKPQMVALKKIYVTSSPHRILNELELLHELRDSPYICPLLTAFRHLDQVVAVLPYFRHLDFRLYYRDFLVNDMRHYFRSLFNGLWHVHKAGILHRDIKPTNFLYDHSRREGVLVDFGLAERQGTDWQPCLCTESKERRRDKFLNSFAVQVLQTQPDLISTGYPKSDSRTSRRANRAGTRGFRAPEVLLKCTSQTTKIDIWSAGVILLTLLARRFPFFNSADDVDAMIEMASIFGRKKMQAVAAMHGQLFETNIETIGERGFTLDKIIIWASCREKEHDTLRAGEAQAVSFLQGLLELDASKRLSAKEALQHEFFTAPVEDEEERAEREAQEAFEEAQGTRRG